MNAPVANGSVFKISTHIDHESHSLSPDSIILLGEAIQSLKSFLILIFWNKTLEIAQEATQQAF